MLDWMFLLGLATGGLFGAAAAIWLTERQMKREMEDWETLAVLQSGQVAELRKLRDTPRAVTRLTSQHFDWDIK